MFQHFQHDDQIERIIRPVKFVKRFFRTADVRIKCLSRLNTALIEIAGFKDGARGQKP